MKTRIITFRRFCTLGFIVGFLAAAETRKDITVCEAVEESVKLSDKEVSVTGELRGGSYHGFGITREGMHPCSPPSLSWLPGRRSVGVIPLDISSSEQSAFEALKKMEPILNTNRGIQVRVVGILRSKRFFFNICPWKDQCLSNGYVGAYPALLEMHSIQMLQAPDHAH